jgi:hypothetical protein
MDTRKEVKSSRKSFWNTCKHPGPRSESRPTRATPSFTQYSTTNYKTKHRNKYVRIVSYDRLDTRAKGVRYPAKGSHCVQSSSEVHPSSYQMGTGGIFSGVKHSWGVNLTTHPHLVPRSRIRSYISSSLVAWMALLHLRKKSCYGFLSLIKIHCPGLGLNPWHCVQCQARWPPDHRVQHRNKWVANTL